MKAFPGNDERMANAPSIQMIIEWKKRYLQSTCTRGQLPIAGMHPTNIFNFYNIFWEIRWLD